MGRYKQGRIRQIGAAARRQVIARAPSRLEGAATPRRRNRCTRHRTLRAPIVFLKLQKCCVHVWSPRNAKAQAWRAKAEPACEEVAWRQCKARSGAGGHNGVQAKLAVQQRAEATIEEPPQVDEADYLPAAPPAPKPSKAATSPTRRRRWCQSSSCCTRASTWPRPRCRHAAHRRSSAKPSSSARSRSRRPTTTRRWRS